VYFSNKFLKIAKCWSLSIFLTFDIGDLKLRDLAKLCFKQITTNKIEHKKQLL